MVGGGSLASGTLNSHASGSLGCAGATREPRDLQGGQHQVLYPRLPIASQRNRGRERNQG